MLGTCQECPANEGGKPEGLFVIGRTMRIRWIIQSNLIADPPLIADPGYTILLHPPPNGTA